MFTMLPSSPHVQQVYTGAHSVLSALQQLPTPSPAERANIEYAQTLCVDSTTLDVDVGACLTPLQPCLALFRFLPLLPGSVPATSFPSRSPPRLSFPAPDGVPNLACVPSPLVPSLSNNSIYTLFYFRPGV